MPADSVIKISPNTGPVQTRARGEQFLTRRVTTLQRTGVIEDNIITREDVNNPAKTRIAIAPRGIAGFAVVPEEMITKMGSVPPALPNRDQLTVVASYMI